MIEIRNCPSSLRDGFDTYSPKAAKSLFGTTKVNPTLGFDIDEFRNVGEIAEAMRRISVSGIQEKFPAIINAGKINIAGDQERSTHILKPAPWDKTLIERKMIPANEHLTMQIASQIYGIQTAANGLCFTPKGQPVYITRRFDILPDGSKLPMEEAAERLPIGTVYPVWTGIGAVGAAIVGIIFFNEPATFWRIFFITTLILSIIGLKVLG